ncbi:MULTISPECIES: adenylate kinase [Capnocytophaga]|jgi:adenylate kinase|uniref:Adenylate kinase n=2 Tax=Capnocytophaga TaxID=1016 RepID=A0A1Z4BKD7_9FLAO|nr:MULTISPECIES: adenylate kinase [Capnocytophaga]ASF41764.1 adenylate kinase [Capnocytophaga endodontalis]MBI1645704.1 adenylate kinase [Capnocytophaga periodontitidis]MBI1667976.1 adenylate kinase [Capnocytophaga periodontitidis]MBM0652816.1 adenylate kinase [Capnocytophaga genosp. AHN8471]MBM0655466.1 adenylate kinase [Capnocytophaga genosp. AHN8471]
MELIKIHDKTFEPYVSAEQLNQIAERMASEVYQDLQESCPVFIAVLNGSFMFAADFVRHYKGECEISFVKMASYEGTQSTGKIHQLIGLSTPVEGRDVVILEDIIDTGNTLEEIYRLFENQKVKSFRIATLFFKPDAYKKDLKIDYVGKPIPNRFIVGYGLDFDEIGRNLPQVYQLNTSLTMTNLVLFGKPGAGKGTQAAFLKDKYNLVHISTGDIFRYNIKNQTKLGKLAQSYMDKGDLVPDEVTIQMLQEEVEKNPNAEGFIFDGFPRTIAQAEALDAFLTSKGMRIHGTLALEADDEVLIKRLLERGKVSGRTDDQDEEKIRNRFTEYNEKTAPLIAFYQAQGKYHPINGIGTIEEITTRLSDTIDKLKAE